MVTGDMNTPSGIPDPNTYAFRLLGTTVVREAHTVRENT